MASRAELEAQAAAQTSVVALAWAQMQAGWAGLGLTSTAIQTQAGIGAVQELLADIISAWGEVSGLLAADLYDELRSQAAPGGTFSARIVDPLNVDQVDRLVLRSLDPVRQATIDDEGTLVVPDELDLDKMLRSFEGTVQRLVRQAGRDAIEESALADPAPRVRVARVPSGATTCAFCLVLASRGYVYRSEETAGGKSPENRFHDFCDCDLDVTFEPTPVAPDGYDPGALYEKYEAAAQTAGSRDLRTILSELRRQEGIR